MRAITLFGYLYQNRMFVKVASSSLLSQVGLMYFKTLEKNINLSIFEHTMIYSYTDINIKEIETY